MCGIVGYIGERQAVPIMLDGLEKLEYRGYDSAGVAVFDGANINVIKKKGRLAVLEKTLETQTLTGTEGIGHTRWATHGAPADMNAHPHTNAAGTISIVHNGIIENYVKIKEWLSTRGYSFKSQTDTEVIVQLIDFYFTGNLMDAVSHAVRRLSGSYAFCVIAKDAPGEIIAARKDSPLVIGTGEGENFIASDIPALLKYTRDVYFMEDDELARITADSIEIFDAYGMPVDREVYHVDWKLEAAEKGGYPHFMLKEIHEEPRAIHDTLASRLTPKGKLDISDLNLTNEEIKDLKRIIIVACGTAFHAGLAAKYCFEKILGIPVEADIASEFRYRSPVIEKGDLFIAISQSGETADTLAALRLASKKGAKVLAIVNAVGSTIAREADAVLYTMAGPEIAVASTKAYSTQIIMLTMLLAALGSIRGSIDKKRYTDLIEELEAMPDTMRIVLNNDKRIKRAAHIYCNVNDMFYFGRNVDYAVSLEGSLKLKEISYIHSEAYAAGELKHGPIALIEKGTLVFVFATQPELYEKTASNIKEVKARGAHVIAICSRDADLVMDLADEVIKLPLCDELLTPVLAVIPAQLFAYYCAVERGFDVDKPRNLAKSVTVE